MAKPISDEELQLKKRARRRLIGAIVLVTAVVVVLPMVLDSEPKPVSQDLEIRIPSPDAGKFTTKVVPVAPAPGTAPARKPSAAVKPEATPAPPPAASVAKPAAGAPEKDAAPLPAKAEVKPAAQEPTSKAPTTGTGGRFVVQVVALSDAQKAKQMQQQIAAAGIQSYTEVVKTAKGSVTRVRVGPFETRGAAEKAQQQLKGIGFDGKVVPR
ncbi:MAG: SPOR domain-containing protein [Betaproteobacteria bacterium]|nr:SPOR domain-containing protein [Betaproteobacteria bacterium]